MLTNKKIGAGAVALLSAGAASAADAGVDAITALSATAALYIAAAFGVAVVTAGGFWGIRFMKKAFSAAS
jgi:hypothetical protein